MSETLKYLQLLADFADRSNVAPGHPFTGEPTPSLARLILECGYRAPRRVDCPVRYRGRAKECYNNAALAVLDNPRRYTYVEGYAASIIPVPHAWVWDRANDAIFDPTWRESSIRQMNPEEYIGVLFRGPYFRKYVYRHKRAALIMGDPKHCEALATNERLRKRALILKDRIDAEV